MDSVKPKPKTTVPVSLDQINTDFSDLYSSLFGGDVDKKKDNDPEPVKVETEEPEPVSVVGGILAGAAADLAVEAIGDAVDGVGIDDVFNIFSIKELPRAEADFAQAWINTINEADARSRLIEYSAYLQVLNELSDGTLVIPDTDGKALALEIKKFVLDDFRKRGVIINVQSNETHRAFFAHCTKRVIDSLDEGIFVGEDGFEGKRPDIARTIRNRINEIYVNKVLSEQLGE